MLKLFTFLIAFAVSLQLHAQVPQKGQPAPEISLPDSKGESVTLSSLKGKVVLIDFWASWCKPCMKTVPDLRTLYSKYHDKGLEIYGITLDADTQSWLNAIQKEKMNWLQVMDTTGNVAAAWNVNYIPHTIIIDQSGKISAVNPSHADIEGLVKQLLSTQSKN